MITADELTELGRIARAERDEIVGSCRNIALRVQELARDRHDVRIEVRELQIGERRDTHFVNIVNSDDYAGDVSGRVLVDASLDQFCTENQHKEGVRVDLGPRRTLPEVAVYPPGAEERHLWYYRPNVPEEGLDVLSGEGET